MGVHTDRGAPSGTPTLLPFMNGTLLWGLLGLLSAAGPGATPTWTDSPVTTTHVRVLEPALAEVVQEGIDRSPTFHRLVQQIDESDGIVYIETGSCSVTSVDACLLLSVTDVEHVRYLHIHVARRPARRDERIRLVGHELQHANEVLSRRRVRNTADAYALFNRIGSAGSIRSFETDEAHHIEELIARELAACAARPQ